MATTAFSSQLSVLKVTITATPTTIPQLRGLRGPSFGNWDIRDITNLTSPSNYKEKLPIMKDPGTVASQMIWNPADSAQEYVRASNAAATAVLETFSEVLSNVDTSTIDFSAYVTKFEVTLNHGEEAIAELELTPTGAISFTP